MDKNLPPIGPRAVVDQALETSLSGRGVALKAGAHPHYEPSSKQKKISRSDVVSKNPAIDMDTLMLTDIHALLSHGAIHSIFKSFGVVLRTRLTYHCDCQSNPCYITFSISADAKAAFEARDSLSIGDAHSTMQLMPSTNIADSDNDYCPNIFNVSAGHTPRKRRIPTHFWFVAYYKKGHGNLIHASRYLEKETG